MRPKIVVEETETGHLIVSKILNTIELRVNTPISRIQLSQLIAAGWSAQRIASSNASSKRRVRSGVRRSLSDAEIFAAIEHSEYVNSAPEIKDIEALGKRKNEKETKKTE